MSGHPPPPGTFTAPNLLAIEEAVGHVAFPISKKELIAEVDGRTVFFAGRNVDLTDLIRDLNDDYFDSEAEFQTVLQNALTNLAAEAGDESAPAQPASQWNDPASGQDRGAADMKEYLDPNPRDSTR